MILKERNGIPFMQFPNLAGYTELTHAMFTRAGGFSNGPYKSLNVSFSIGDNEGDVEKNRKAVLNCVGGQEFVYAKQAHGKDVLVFSKDDNCIAKGPFVGDALISDIPGQMLLIKVADCQPILLHDPVRKVVANIHSGWRGSIKNIIGNTVQTMTGRYGCSPGDLLAGIGPSLGPCCAEFINFRTEIPEKFWDYKDHDDKFDFWSISRDQLCESGIPEGNMHISRMCTMCDTDRFFSYRGEKTTGRMAAVIGII